MIGGASVMKRVYLIINFPDYSLLAGENGGKVKIRVKPKNKYEGV